MMIPFSFVSATFVESKVNHRKYVKTMRMGKLRRITETGISLRTSRYTEWITNNLLKFNFSD